jgi:hypothetical protein
MKTFALALVLTSVACSSTQKVVVRSEPAGAAVSVACGPVQNEATLVTPAVVKVDRRPGHCAISLAKDGFLPATVTLKKSRSAWSVTNVVAAVLMGRVADTTHAAVYDRTPAAIDVKLEKR